MQVVSFKNWHGFSQRVSRHGCDKLFRYASLFKRSDEQVSEGVEFGANLMILPPAITGIRAKDNFFVTMVAIRERSRDCMASMA